MSDKTILDTTGLTRRQKQAVKVGIYAGTAVVPFVVMLLSMLLHVVWSQYDPLSFGAAYAWVLGIELFLFIVYGFRGNDAGD